LAAQTFSYRPQLDGIRALAIALVLFGHFGSDWGLASHVSIGYLGVELFFVLSGFLITSILLGDVEAIESRRQTLKGAFGRFYAGRALRIFPTYYLTIVFALVAGLGITKASFPWFATYLSNVYIVMACPDPRRISGRSVPGARPGTAHDEPRRRTGTIDRRFHR